MAILGATALGYFMNKLAGAVILFLLSTIATTICFIGALLYGQLGLISAIAAIAVLAVVVGSRLSGRRGARCVSLMWIGYCIFCAFGYQTNGAVGLITITLPSIVLFWVCVYFAAQQSLPIGHSVSHRLLAFRALLTYTLGTNYPYYDVKNRRVTLRVRGNPFRQFFAGPGIVMTSCDHAAVIVDGTKIKGVNDPGFSFTGGFETIGEIIDLRTQLRAFSVEALTKDGLRVKVLTFVPFRIYAGSWPQLGKSFLFQKSAIFQAAQGQLVEYSRAQKDGKVVETKQMHVWDERVSIVATRIIRQIISGYSFDDLCAPYQPQRNPRMEIAENFRFRLRDELRPFGIEVLGGGISNLLPVDSQLMQQRIDNWQAEWQRRITAEIGKGEAEYIRVVESARAQARAEMIRTISEGFERAGPIDKGIPTQVLAFRFIEALEKMSKTSAVEQAQVPSWTETVEAMRRAIETQQR